MKIEAQLGDLTTEVADALVNAANSTLLGGGGVDGALHAAAGPALLEACRVVRKRQWPAGLPVGEAVATTAGNLPARWVIHTVGPNRNRGQDDPDLLASCYRRSLAVASDLGAATIAFPAIGAGAFGWDPASAAEIAVQAVRSSESSRIERVRFILFSPRLLEAFSIALESA